MPRMEPVKYIVFEGKIIRRSPKAVHMRYTDTSAEERTEWIAKSQFSQAMQDDLDNDAPLYTMLEWELAEWLAKQNQVVIL